MKKVLYILNLNFNNKKRNSVNCDGDSYGFLDDKESLDFIRAEARLGQNLKPQLFLVYSLLALVPHCICPFLLDAGGCGLVVGAGAGAGAGYWGKVDEKYAHHHHRRGQRSCFP